MIDYTVKGDNGQGGTVSTDYVLQSLRNNGENIVGMSPDGAVLTMQDGQGTFEVNTADAMKTIGWNVQGMTPKDADYSGVSPGMRAAVQKLPSDDARRAYIGQTMARQGMQSPQIIGSGRDWYVFNPQSGKYTALTNTPGWDMGDLAEGGLEVPRAIASALGGGAGAIAGGGVGSIPAAMAGAAGGGALADTAERGLLAAFDPEYRNVAKENLGGMAWDVGKGAAIDAAGAGLIKGVGALAPVSRVAQALGMGAEATGSAARGVANLADNPLGHTMATLGVPGVAEADTLGMLVQAPAWMTRAGVKGLDALGNSATMRQFAPGFASKVAGLAGRLGEEGLPTATRAQTIQQGAERIGQRLGAPAATMAEEAPRQMRPSDIMGNAFREARIRGGEVYRKMAGRASARGPTDLAGYRTARQFGFDPAAARDLADDSLHKFAAEETAAATRAAGYGRRVGQAMETAENAGKVIQKGTETLGKGIVKGVKHAGGALQATGTGLRAAGTVMKPLEDRALMRAGAEEAYRGSDFENWLAGRKRRESGTMKSVLAQN